VTLQRIPRLAAPPWLLLALLNLAVVPLALVGLHSPDTDTFYHLAGGRHMAQHLAILDREVFSFTIPGEPWTNYYWLFEALLYGLYQLGGFSAIIAFRAAIVVLTANLILLLARRHAGPAAPLLALGVALLAFAVYIPRGQVVRPHLLSYLLLATTLLLLERLWRRPGSFDLWVPALCLLWANLHGVEYPIPLAAIAIYGAAALVPRLTRPAAVLRDRDAMRWVALFALSALAFLANPFGWRLLATPLIAVDAEVMRTIAEMAPPDPASLLRLFPETDVGSKVFFRYALLATALALPVWVARRDPRAALAGLLGAALALRRTRFAVEFAILALPFAAGAFAALREGPAGRRRLVDGAALLLVGLVGVASLHSAWTRFEQGQFRPLADATYPVGAARFIERQGLGGNLFTDPTVAGYVTWALYPEVRVAMDMRTPEPFNAQVSWLVRAALGAADLRIVERRWPIDLVLLAREAPLAARLARGPGSGFALVYADHRFVLFAHERLRARRPDLRSLEVLDPFDAALGYVRRLSLGERETLESELVRLARVWGANRLALETRYALLMTVERAADALRTAQDLVARAPWMPAYPYYAGLALRALGDDAAALPHLERALRLDPAFLPAYPTLADTARALGRLPLALATMERYLRRQDYLLAPDEFLLLGALRAHAGHPAPAADAFQRALWLAPDAARAGLARLIAEPATPAAIRDVARARLEGAR
jgi:tetratricopeptide (TPR) repeat protein